jgi:hypothetical protein
VSVVLSVEELPFTPMGCASWFPAKAPPDLTDSAERESPAMGPVDSCGRLGSFGFGWDARGLAAVEPIFGPLWTGQPSVINLGYLCWNGLR